MSEKPNLRTPVTVPMSHLPIFRTSLAIQDGIEKNLLFITWGGLGDQMCAEPTLRHAIKKFTPSCDISLASEQPGLFAHLPFKRVFDLNEETPNYKKYFTFQTITAPDQSNLVWQFFSHMLTNCVDFPALCALRSQLPVDEREIQLSSVKPAEEIAAAVKGGILIHAGKHWQSKTFPKSFWDAVLSNITKMGKTPILIGANTDDNRGTVDVETDGCLDLRNKLSVLESTWACQQASVLLTNDSSPMHMAASGDAWVGFIATCKHPDFITHWRHGQWQWREKNFGKGGVWDHIDYCPNKQQEISHEFVDPKLLESWLPSPEEFAAWAVERNNETNQEN